MQNNHFAEIKLNLRNLYSKILYKKINIIPIQMHIKASNKPRIFKQYISYNI